MKWVTWENVGIDRIGCAWLILREIDPKAQFVFVPRGGPLPSDAEPFDVPAVRFSHHGGHCSFYALFMLGTTIRVGFAGDAFDAAPKQVLVVNTQDASVSFVDAVDVSTGKLLDRLTSVNKPCCVERIPSPSDSPIRVLVSNLGDGTPHLVEVGTDGKMKDILQATVGKALKRVAFVPVSTP